MEVTFSKQWIHFLRSERWPPTSTILVTTTRQRPAPPPGREVFCLVTVSGS